MSFILSFILIIGIQFVLSYLFTKMGFNYYLTDTLINLVLSFLFSYIRFRNLRLEAFKNVYFHKSVASYFVVLMLISVLFWFI